MRLQATFRKIQLSSSKTGKCPICGKAACRKKTFYQTLNPFNRTITGELKSREDILNELKTKINEWEKDPVYHSKCE